MEKDQIPQNPINNNKKSKTNGFPQHTHRYILLPVLVSSKTGGEKEQRFNRPWWVDNKYLKKEHFFLSYLKKASSAFDFN